MYPALHSAYIGTYDVGPTYYILGDWVRGKGGICNIYQGLGEMIGSLMDPIKG